MIPADEESPSSGSSPRSGLALEMNYRRPEAATANPVGSNILAGGEDAATGVEMIGLEPTTPCLQSRCSAKLSYIPIGSHHDTSRWR